MPKTSPEKKKRKLLRKEERKLIKLPERTKRKLPERKIPPVPAGVTYTYNGYAIYPHIKDFMFAFLKVTTAFTPKFEFSGAKIPLTHYVSKDGLSSLGLSLDELIEIDLSVFMEPEKRREDMKAPFHRLISFLKMCKGIVLNLEHCTEASMLSTLTQNILIPLFGNVLYSANKNMKTMQGADLRPLGLGSIHTWHGVPDLRIEDCNLISSSSSDVEVIWPDSDSDSYKPSHDQSDESDESIQSAVSEESLLSSHDVSFVNVEAKKEFRVKYTGQLVSLAVVSSFTEKNLCSLETPIPTILIDKRTIRIALYDVDKDILLLSQPKNIMSEKGGISRTTVLILWLIIHHKIFFKPLAGFDTSKYASKIKEQLKATNDLQFYEQLKETNVKWSSAIGPRGVDIDFLPLVSVSSLLD